MKKLIILTLFTTLGGCSADEAITSTDKDSTSVMPDSIALIADVKKSEEIAKKSKEFNEAKLERELDGTHSAKHTIQINKHKITTKNLILKTNQSIYNMDINSFGVVKGSIVVVSTVEPQGVEQYFNINKIAKDTYQLSVKSSEEDLYYWYKKLSSDSQYSTVELEIDYSRKNDLQTY